MARFATVGTGFVTLPAISSEPLNCFLEEAQRHNLEPRVVNCRTQRARFANESSRNTRTNRLINALTTARSKEPRTAAPLYSLAS